MSIEKYYLDLIEESGMEIISCSKCGLERIVEFQVYYRSLDYFTKCYICGIFICDDCYEDWVQIGDRDYQCKKCEEEYYKKHPKKCQKETLKNDLEKQIWYSE